MFNDSFIEVVSLVQFFIKDNRLQEVSHPDSVAIHLISINGSDASFGAARCEFSLMPSKSFIHNNMIGHNDVSSFTHLKFWFNAAFLQ